MEVYRKLTHSHKHTFSHPHTFAMLIVAAKGMKQTARVEKGAGTPPSPINSKSKASFWVVVVGVCPCVTVYSCTKVKRVVYRGLRGVGTYARKVIAFDPAANLHYCGNLRFCKMFS